MAGNSKDSKILAYKDMINQLNKTISTQTELIQSLQKTLEADRLEKENLRQQIEYLTKKLFGTSSEKRKDIDGQLNLFDEAEQEADPTWEQELPDDITVPEHKRKARRTHADLFKNVPSCDEIISLPEEERNCPTCGTQMECIGKEFVRHEFRFTPAKGKVVNIYRETYKCPECAISEEHPDDQTFVKAPVQEPLIPESYASESVVGWAMHQKYQNGLPLNRQESEWTQLGVPLSRATLANWIIYCAENYLRHVYDYFHRQLRMRKYLMADETRVQVLNEPERNPETDSWMWLFRSGEDGLPPILLYHYTEKVKGFLYTTARNLALNHIKHNQIVDEHLRLQEKDSVLFFRNQIIEEETYQLVHKAVEQLPKQSCKIIQLSLQGYSNQEIADQLNISINSVRTLKQSAYKKLRGILKEHFYLLPLMLKMNFF